MKKNILKYLFSSILVLSLLLQGYAQEAKDTEDWSKKPEVITPGKKDLPPSDAIVLFDGGGFSKWSGNEGPAQWKLKGKAMEVVKGTGIIKTNQSFGSIQLHIEWRSPKKVLGESQGRGNSGIFLMGLYEVQVLDSYDNETYYNGQAGSIYKQHIPLVNACMPPGKWQSYDIIFTTPVFNADKSLQKPGYITVIHNGVLIQNHVELKGPTRFVGIPEYSYHEEKLPLTLQDHGNPVMYRNIWVRELN
ncbi:MAG: DUF1080 domain-containing protein [Bacteroidales bacterium]|nr:DUF1080 domain-containing protein [Bacteroidales bacterium]